MSTSAGGDIPLSLKPMEAKPVEALPTGKGWLFESKYDGFRCLAFRDRDEIQLQSKNQRPLARYFPELLAGLEALPHRFVIDGEIVIPGEPFETLQLRLHLAAIRVARLSKAHPAALIAFDLLQDGDGTQLLKSPFSDRRAALEAMLARYAGSFVLLSAATNSREEALSWLGAAGLDGIVAKRLDEPYRPGTRAMLKYKQWRTVDCVVAGIYLADRGAIDSLLLGLYDIEGQLHYVGRTRVYKGAAEMAELLKPLVGGEGFTGRSPAAENRWSGRKNEAVPLEPRLVAEVSADHISSGHMRHGARLLRWRTDKRPEECTMDQIA